MSGPVILFGLDGATFTVLDDLVRRGVMPYLGRFMASGARGVLLSTVPPLTPPAWTTLVTGRTPGHHGITNFLQYESDDSRYLRLVTSRELCCETIWSIASRQGRRAGSLNFVAHNPAPKINGYVIPGWVPWRWVKKHSHPADLIDRLKGEIPGFDVRVLALDLKVEHKAIAGEMIEDYESWIDLHIRREPQWFNILRYQMKHDPCALVGVVFDGVDKLQHLLWEHLDPTMEPQSPSEGFLRIRRHCWDYFRQLDRFLEETVKLAGPDGHVFVVSDHGFTGSGETLFINTWLEQQGYLTWAPGVEVAPDDSHELVERRPYNLSALELSKTRAYAHSPGSNGICIPVKGDRGDVGVTPEEYDSFRAELMDALRTRCVDPETQEPLIADVWTREEVFHGPRMGLAPDLTVRLRDNGFFSVLRGSQALKKRPMVIGTHHPEGVFIVHGPGVREDATLQPARLADVAPTVLYALGLPIPEDFEGSLVTGAFTPEYLVEHLPICGSATVRPAHLPPDESRDRAYEPESEAEMLMRLRALGYVE